jgi:Ca2+-binding RTX toxin-like protein
MHRTLRVAVATAALLLVGSQVAFAGSPPYTDGPDVIITDNHKNTVRGGQGRDVLDTRGGADVLRGDKNSDSLFGGDGDDLYHGNAGNDEISEYSTYEEPDVAGDGDGFTGRDIVYAGVGADYVETARGNDVIYAGPGSDRCEGADDCVMLYGDTGNDTIYGGDGDDDMEGEQGDDRLYGQTGDDFIDAEDDESVGGTDYVDCGPGNDVAEVNEDDTVVNCETVLTFPIPTEEPPLLERLREDRQQAAVRKAALARR